MLDYIHESLALGVDLFILGLCVREYVSFKRSISVLKAAPHISIDGDLMNLVAGQNNNKIPYVVLRGTVTPIGVPMRSVMSPSVTSVLQVIKLSEHRIARGLAGFWSEQRKLLNVSTNEMPFELRNNDYAVEIVDALQASLLDLDVVYDNYEPSSLSFFDHVFGFFSGIRQKGLQTTEEVLRDGSVVTAIGELELDGQTLRLQAGSAGPLFITTSTKLSLVKKFEQAKSSTVIKIIISGAVAAFLLGMIARKIIQKRKQQRAKRDLRSALERERRTRRACLRPDPNLTPEQLCVVCSTNPKEVIILPCGHVCICEECSARIQSNCPVCRSKIDNRAAAFIS